MVQPQLTFLPYLWTMDLLDFIFRLGVLFAIYGFIWGLIELGIALLSANRSRSLIEIYTIRALKYFFLVDVTFLFCVQGEVGYQLITNRVIMAALLLLTYFIGKLQNNQNRQQLFRLVTINNQRPRGIQVFSLRAEMLIISLSLVVFGAFWFFPEYASNPISLWFHESIVNIEDTPIFGFLFQIVGFFFIISLIFKMSGALGYILSGQAFRDVKKQDSTQSSDRKDDFDDFTEVD